MAEAGTPTFFSASLTAAAIFGFMSGYAFDGEEPHQMLFRGGDVEGNRGAAHDVHPIDWWSARSRARAIGRHSPQGSPSIFQTANSAVHSTNIHTT